MRRWYISVTEITRISAIGVINVQFFKERGKIIPNTQQHNTRSKNQSDSSVQRKARRRKSVVRLVRGISRNIGRVKRKGNKARNIFGRESERKTLYESLGITRMTNLSQF